MKKIICVVLIVASMAASTFSAMAAGSDTKPVGEQNINGDGTTAKQGSVDVNGKVGPWDPNDPDLPPDVNPPDNVASLSVSIPTNMYFQLVTNAVDESNIEKPVLATATYTFKNNSVKEVDVKLKSITPTSGNTIVLSDVTKAASTTNDDKFDLSLNLTGFNSTPVPITDTSTDVTLCQLDKSSSKKVSFSMNGFDQSKDNDGYLKNGKWNFAFEFSLVK